MFQNKDKLAILVSAILVSAILVSAVLFSAILVSDITPSLQHEVSTSSESFSGEMRLQFTPATTLSGICKPGDKLLNILSPSPTHNSHCEEAMARTTNTEMVIVTLRHRHDLEPDNPIHLETALVNAFIQELAVRYGTRVVYRINRQCFTAHGQHLNMSGKRKQAELVVESLAAGRLKPRVRVSETRVRRQILRSHSSSHTTSMPTRSRRL
ncbi:hypothetical protein J6590_093687 [Homalodisca vitripennis]|nr:hypothetical protein J6590_093687 [Homalodisca vitripennis]